MKKKYIYKRFMKEIKYKMQHKIKYPIRIVAKLVDCGCEGIEMMMNKYRDVILRSEN